VVSSVGEREVERVLGREKERKARQGKADMDLGKS
jgi:hypothetical protein